MKRRQQQSPPQKITQFELQIEENPTTKGEVPDTEIQGNVIGCNES